MTISHFKHKIFFKLTPKIFILLNLLRLFIYMLEKVKLNGQMAFTARVWKPSSVQFQTRSKTMSKPNNFLIHIVGLLGIATIFLAVTPPYIEAAALLTLFTVTTLLLMGFLDRGKMGHFSFRALFIFTAIYIYFFAVLRAEIMPGEPTVARIPIVLKGVFVFYGSLVIVFAWGEYIALLLTLLSKLSVALSGRPMPTKKPSQMRVVSTHKTGNKPKQTLLQAIIEWVTLWRIWGWGLWTWKPFKRFFSEEETQNRIRKADEIIKDQPQGKFHEEGDEFNVQIR